MPTVTFSKGLLSVFYDSMIGLSHQYNFINRSQTSNDNYSRTYMTLMSGTMPTDFSTLTVSTSLQSQVLWHTRLASTDFDNETEIHGGNTINNKFVLNMENYVSAQQTGTVEWFRIMQHNATGSTQYTDYNDYSQLNWQIIGSVGTSGTDLILPTTSISNSKSYRIRGLEFTLNQDHTY